MSKNMSEKKDLENGIWVISYIIGLFIMILINGILLFLNIIDMDRMYDSILLVAVVSGIGMLLLKDSS